MCICEYCRADCRSLIKHACGNYDDDGAVVDELLRRPDVVAAINEGDKNGDTALHWTARSGPGQAAIASALLASGAAVDLKDNFGFTPLLIAAYQSDPTLVKLLLKAGADPTLKDNDGMTALDYPPNMVSDECKQIIRDHLKAGGGKMGAGGSRPGLAPPTTSIPRSSRLDSNIKILYHTTSRDAAKAILSSRRFNRGASGMAGGGIYFATTASDTLHKALAPGTYKSILEVRVKLGNVKRISPSGDPSITFQTLQREGYDSVLMPRNPGGDEYVVYNSDQAEPIKII